MLRKWRERDSARLRKLEREHELLLLEVELLKSEIKSIRKSGVTHTHTQRLEVELVKPVEHPFYM